MIIRDATYKDAPEIKLLLEAIGYIGNVSLLVHQLELLFGQKDHRIFVYEMNKEVVGFISVHFLPQLALDGELVLISYLSVDDTVKDRGIGRALEQHVVTIALKRKCDKIQVHCLERRTWEHGFFAQLGYQEYPKYFSKQLIYAE
jgi:N-acetylglutamate synthase-like GNAT family acetyltransferase